MSKFYQILELSENCTIDALVYQYDTLRLKNPEKITEYENAFNFIKDEIDNRDIDPQKEVDGILLEMLSAYYNIVGLSNYDSLAVSNLHVPTCCDNDLMQNGYEEIFASILSFNNTKLINVPQRSVTEYLFLLKALIPKYHENVVIYEVNDFYFQKLFISGDSYYTNKNLICWAVNRVNSIFASIEEIKLLKCKLDTIIESNILVEIDIKKIIDIFNPNFEVLMSYEDIVNLIDNGLPSITKEDVLDEYNQNRTRFQSQISDELFLHDLAKEYLLESAETDEDVISDIENNVDWVVNEKKIFFKSLLKRINNYEEFGYLSLNTDVLTKLNQSYA